MLRGILIYNFQIKPSFSIDKILRFINADSIDSYGEEHKN